MGQEQKEYTWNLIGKKLTGEATPQELKELEDLLRAHPELYYPLQTLADFWRSSSPGDLEDAELALDRHLDRIKDQFHPQYPTQNTRRTRKFLLLAPIALFIIISVGLILSRSKQAPPLSTKPIKELSEVTTRIGSRTSLVLPDSTLVWLNAGSRLTYGKDFGSQQREVTLTGEALFDVAHDPHKPFIIHAARVDIRVLGTRFDIKSYPTDKTTETTLLKGSIEVSVKARPNEKIILKPNEKLVIANDDSVLNRKLTPEENTRSKPNESLVSILKPGYDATTGANIETAWADDWLIFQDQSFSVLAKDMERWYDVKIQFTKKAQEEWRFTGSFQKETIQQALEALKLTAPFTYTIHENQITIYDK